MARGPCTCKEANPWGLIPRVWLPRGFFHRRLQEPYVTPAAAAAAAAAAASAAAASAADASASGGSTKKRKREPLLIASPSAASSSSSSAAAAAAATPAAAGLSFAPHTPGTSYPPGSIGAEFGVPYSLFAPAAKAPGGSSEESAEAAAEKEKEEAAAAAAAAAAGPTSHAWYVAEVLEHRLKRGKAGAHEFRVRWVGLRPNDRRHKKWHPFSIFRTEGHEGLVPGETVCTLVDVKVAAFMKKHKIT